MWRGHVGYSFMQPKGDEVPRRLREVCEIRLTIAKSKICILNKCIYVQSCDVLLHREQMLMLSLSGSLHLKLSAVQYDSYKTVLNTTDTFENLKFFR